MRTRAVSALRYGLAVASEPDPIFADRRLASIYDDVDADRTDLDHYEAIVDEFGARRVLDVGCGTGTLACRLAGRGVDVVGLDPARASLDVARSKTDAERVAWIHGDTSGIPSDIEPFELAVMTGNVAQVFTTDAAWSSTLGDIAGALRSGGRLVFETRDPAQRAWENWDTAGMTTTVATARGEVEVWTSLLDVSEPLVTFRHHYRFVESREVVTSDSTLRFRTLDELRSSLGAARFAIDDVRDAPDRPGLELVVVARLTS